MWLGWADEQGHWLALEMVAALREEKVGLWLWWRAEEEAFWNTHIGCKGSWSYKIMAYLWGERQRRLWTSEGQHDWLRERAQSLGLSVSHSGSLEL